MGRGARLSHRHNQFDKPRVMFRPAKKMGATGIREIMEWSRSEPGKFRKGQGAVTIDDEPAGHCGDLGYCGG